MFYIYLNIPRNEKKQKKPYKNSKVKSLYKEQLNKKN